MAPRGSRYGVDNDEEYTIVLSQLPPRLRWQELNDALRRHGIPHPRKTEVWPPHADGTIIGQSMITGTKLALGCASRIEWEGLKIDEGGPGVPVSISVLHHVGSDRQRIWGPRQSIASSHRARIGPPRLVNTLNDLVRDPMAANPPLRGRMPNTATRASPIRGTVIDMRRSSPASSTASKTTRSSSSSGSGSDGFRQLSKAQWIIFSGLPPHFTATTLERKLRRYGEVIICTSRTSSGEVRAQLSSLEEALLVVKGMNGTNIFLDGAVYKLSVKLVRNSSPPPNMVWQRTSVTPAKAATRPNDLEGPLVVGNI